MKWKLNKNRNKDEGVVRLDGQEVPKSECFRYLASRTQKDGGCES